MVDVHVCLSMYKKKGLHTINRRISIIIQFAKELHVNY